jgi:hypothetical protein
MCVQNVYRGLIDVAWFKNSCVHAYAGCSYVIMELNSILALCQMEFAHSICYMAYWESLLSSSHKHISYVADSS